MAEVRETFSIKFLELTIETRLGEKSSISSLEIQDKPNIKKLGL